MTAASQTRRGPEAGADGEGAGNGAGAGTGDASDMGVLFAAFRLLNSGRLELYRDRMTLCGRLHQKLSAVSRAAWQSSTEYFIWMAKKGCQPREELDDQLESNHHGKVVGLCTSPKHSMKFEISWFSTGLPEGRHYG